EALAGRPMQSIALGAALLLLFAIAAAVAVRHMDNLLSFIVIAPGYLVQAWLFETHRALGGVGYQVTMVGVSALVWTLLSRGPAAGSTTCLRTPTRAAAGFAGPNRPSRQAAPSRSTSRTRELRSTKPGAQEPRRCWRLRV